MTQQLWAPRTGHLQGSAEKRRCLPRPALLQGRAERESTAGPGSSPHAPSSRGAPFLHPPPEPGSSLRLPDRGPAPPSAGEHVGDPEPMERQTDGERKEGGGSLEGAGKGKPGPAPSSGSRLCPQIPSPRGGRACGAWFMMGRGHAPPNASPSTHPKQRGGPAGVRWRLLLQVAHFALGQPRVGRGGRVSRVHFAPGRPGHEECNEGKTPPGGTSSDLGWNWGPQVQGCNQAGDALGNSCH